MHYTYRIQRSALSRPPRRVLMLMLNALDPKLSCAARMADSNSSFSVLASTFPTHLPKSNPNVEKSEKTKDYVEVLELNTTTNAVRISIRAGGLPSLQIFPPVDPLRLPVSEWCDEALS